MKKPQLRHATYIAVVLTFVKTRLTFQAKHDAILITVHYVSYNTPHITALQWYQILFSICHVYIFAEFSFVDCNGNVLFMKSGPIGLSFGTPTPEKPLVLIEADH